MLSEAQILQLLRKICRAINGTNETVTFGHPTFQVNGKPFTALETYKGELGICVKGEKELQGVFLDDPRFFRTPYIGKHGWVTLRVYAARLNWTEIKQLVRGSHPLVGGGAVDSKAQRSKIKRKSSVGQV